MAKNKNIESFLKNVSSKDSGWLEKAKWRQANEDWLDVSFSIAVKILSALTANKKANVYPKTQVELAEAMRCSAQYVNKLLRGQENLQIETICKVQRILDITLIEVPKEVKPYIKENISQGNIDQSPVFYNTAMTDYTKTVNVQLAEDDSNYALAA
ncbi:MAG: helix-turn-helix transcriptional regulator [Bacteroidetes bacterium]|nr:helix-turn-helix transcriptional regulator [Bacteroidota bacterium]